MELPNGMSFEEWYPIDNARTLAEWCHTNVETMGEDAKNMAHPGLLKFLFCDFLLFTIND